MGNEEIIKKFIVDEIISNNSKNNLNYEDSLIEAGVIDSLGIMKMLAFLDEQFSISIEDQEVIPENFETIKAISDLVEKKRL